MLGGKRKAKNLFSKGKMKWQNIEILRSISWTDFYP